MRVSRCGWYAIGLALAVFMITAGRSLAKEHGEATVTRQLGNDLFASGPDVRLADEIYGDAVAAGGSVTLDSQVRGDALIAGGDLKLRGTTDEDLYAAGGEVQVGGHVAGSARIAGGEIDLDRDAVIDGAASIAGGRVAVEGRVGQYLQIAAGSTRIDGRVGGDVEVAGGELKLGPGAVIEGALTFRGPKPPQVADGAQVRGGVKHIPESKHRGAMHAAFGWFALVWLVGWLIVACLALAIWPGFTRSVSDTATQRFGWSLLTGLLICIAVPVAIVLLTVSLIGIPLGLLVLCLYLVLLPLGYLAFAAAIGDWLLARVRRGAAIATRHRLLMLLGVLVVLFVIARIPFVGRLVSFLVLLAGMGSLLLAAAARYRRNGATTTSAA